MLCASWEKGRRAPEHCWRVAAWAEGAGTYFRVLSARHTAAVARPPASVDLATVCNSHVVPRCKKSVSMPTRKPLTKKQIRGARGEPGCASSFAPARVNGGLVQRRFTASRLHLPGRVNTDGTERKGPPAEPVLRGPRGPTWRNNTPINTAVGMKNKDGDDSPSKTAILQGEVQLSHYFCQLGDLERC